MEIQELGKVAKELLDPQFRRINDDSNIRVKIHKAFLSKKSEGLLLHLVLAKSGVIEFNEPNFHQKMEEKLGMKIDYHMSYKNEAGQISDPQVDSYLLFTE